jgi:S1-C subfamily serine protease
VALVAALALAGVAFVSGLEARPDPGRDASGPRAASVDRTRPGAVDATGIDAQAVADRADDAVVNITTTVAGGGEAAGTGMVLTQGGEVLTNFHVIDGAVSIAVEVGVSGETYRATVAGYDEAKDLAVLELTRASGLDTVDLGDASSVSVGDGVVAIGNAAGRGGPPAAVEGVVTDLGRTITAGNGAASETLSNMIEISAAIESGDSGGPVVDAGGAVVGVTTAADVGRARFGTEVATTGYAIPIDEAEQVVARIRSGSTAGGVHLGPRGYLGVQATDADGSGALVAGVQSGSAADEAGIGRGSVITAVGGTRVEDSEGLRSALGAYAAGDRVRVVWTDSGGTTRRATVTLTDLS